jgi:hypothetical protein
MFVSVLLHRGHEVILLFLTYNCRNIIKESSVRVHMSK